MKKAASFRLSEEALKHLANFAENMFPEPRSQASVLEWMIEHRASVSDKTRNNIRKEEAWKKYKQNHIGEAKQEWKTFKNDDFLDEFIESEIRRAFFMGYNTGWLHFQTRHKDNDPIIDL